MLDLELLFQQIANRCIAPGAGEKLLAGAIPHANLRPAAEKIRQISEHYLKGSTEEHSDVITSPSHADAYAAYFLPINLFKFRRVLREIFPTDTGPLKILDVGAGPGTGSFAALSSLPGDHSITLVESNPHMRHVAEDLCAALSLQKVEGVINLNDLEEEERFELILVGNLLNELSVTDAQRLLGRLVTKLAAQGTLLLLEPALKETTQLLMSHRDWLLESYTDLAPRFPCTHSSPCPMRRARADDWCHGTLTWEPPLLVRQLDELTGFNKHRIKFSAFACSRGSSIPQGYRVLSDAERTNAGDTATVCGEDHCGPLTLFKRHRTEENSKFKRVRSLDIVTINPPPQGGSIGAESKVTPLVQRSHIG